MSALDVQISGNHYKDKGTLMPNGVFVKSE